MCSDQVAIRADRVVSRVRAVDVHDGALHIHVSSACHHPEAVDIPVGRNPDGHGRVGRHPHASGKVGA